MFNIFRSKPPVNQASAPPVQPTEPLNPFLPQIPKYNGVAPKERYDQIEYAFTSGGVDYFKFGAEVNIPFQRAVAARDILTEELWQIEPNFLKAWVDGVLNLLVDGTKKNEKKLLDLGIMATRLKEQLDLSFSLVRQIKLASVIYFDEYENPLDYQFPYNQKKIKSWMENNDVPGFFLNLLDFQLVPSLKELEQNFPNYLQAETNQKLADLKHTISLMSSGKESADLLKILDSQMEMLSDINTWSKGQYTSIT